MSVRMTSYVWDLPDIEGTELLVMLALADFADDAGRCWPSMDAVATRVRRSDRAVRTIIRNLEARGILECPDKAGGRGRSNRYLIVQKAEAQTSGYEGPEKAEKAEKAEAQTSGLKGAKGGSFALKAEVQTSEEPSLRTINKGRKKDSPAFAEFWEVYPRKLGKKAALARFSAAVKSGVSSRHMIDAAARYAAHVSENRISERYIKHPTTWLNQGCWDDELKPETERTTADDRLARKMEMARGRDDRREAFGGMADGEDRDDAVLVLSAGSIRGN